MEIKDLKSAVKLGSEMADVRGGMGGINIGNVDQWSKAYTDSYIYNEGVKADLNVTVSGSQFNGGGFGDIVSAPSNKVTNTVTQTPTSYNSNQQAFEGLNFNFSGGPFAV